MNLLIFRLKMKEKVNEEGKTVKTNSSCLWFENSRYDDECLWSVCINVQISVRAAEYVSCFVLYNFLLMLILFSVFFFFFVGLIRLDLFCVCGYVVNERVGFAWFWFQLELKAWFAGEDRDMAWERDYILFIDEELSR